MKKVIALLMAICMLCALGACSSSSASTSTSSGSSSDTAVSGTTTAGAPVETTVLKLGLSHNEDSANYYGCKVMADYVYEQSGGRLKIDLYPSNSLGEEAELMEGLVMGTVDMALLPPGIVASYSPIMQVFDMPFLFSDWDQVDAVLYGDIGADLITQAEEQSGITIFNFCEGGFRSMINNVRPIYTPSDLDGLQIRVPNWAGLVKAVEYMGGIPVILAFGEVYAACSSGLVDGQEGTAFAIVSNNFYEVCHYYSLTRHIYNPMMFCACSSSVKALDADLQDILREGCIAGGKAQTEKVRSEDEANMQLMVDKGMEINEVNDINEFKKLAMPVWDEFSDVLSPDLLQSIANS